MADTSGQTPQTQPEAASLSRIGQLNATERHWAWKAGIRVVICILNIIAIGCAAYLVSEQRRTYGRDYYYDTAWLSGPAVVLIVTCVSTVWCLVWIIIPNLLKPPRPLHPGIAVGIDLILWLSFIVAALFALGGAWSYAYSGEDLSYTDGGSSYYSGHYELAPNGTWVYEITSNDSAPHYNYTTQEYEYDTTDLSNITRDCTPEFDSCAEQDQFVNEVWRSRMKRRALAILVDAIGWADVLLHFALFVWACVDTHRWNRGKGMTQEKIVADRIIADLERRGLVSVQNGVVSYSSAAAPAPAPTTAPAPASATQPTPQMTQTPSYPRFHTPQQPVAPSNPRPTGDGPTYE